MPQLPEPRYVDAGLIGIGGMGEVRRVHDSWLGRDVAMKLLRPDLDTPAARARFMAEARQNASLQHPNLVPVYDVGILAGRSYFTMKEIQGEPLGRWLARGPSQRSALDLFATLCDAVAYAHGRGVVHRDLKPANVRVEGPGAVYVLDWGLSRPSGAGAAAEGTAAYMSPEQARGDSALPATDVYALGAILYEILTGNPPYRGRTHADVLDQVRSGPPPHPRIANPELSDELVEIVVASMERDPARRPQDGAALAVAIHAWLEGARRREEAERRLREAVTLDAEIQRLRAEVRDREQAVWERGQLTGPLAPKAEKRVLRDAEDALAARRRHLASREAEEGQLLQTALNLAALPEAHARLADLAHARFSEAERRRDAEACAGLEVELRTHDTLGRYTRFLAGSGALTLHTDPPAAVDLYRYVERDRRLVAVFDRHLGRTPLDAVEVPMGSHLLAIRAQGRALVRYPVLVGRQEHALSRAPGCNTPHVLRLPRRDELGPNEVFVAAGPWWRGDRSAVLAGAMRYAETWSDSFVIARFPVQNHEYIRFLNAVAAGPGDRPPSDEDAVRAQELAPAERLGGGRANIYGWDPEGRSFFLQPDRDGDIWGPDWPVLMVSWAGARAYAAWRAMCDGRSWTLPTEDQWEKAARGVDGRLYPWGDHVDPTWACTRDSFATARSMKPTAVTSFPLDRSPYGVRGMGGNARDWCLDSARGEGRGARGGAWTWEGALCQIPRRVTHDELLRSVNLGFRIARPFE